MDQYDMYEAIDKIIEERYSMKNYESEIKEFFISKYGKEETRKMLLDIKELAKYLSENM